MSRIAIPGGWYYDDPHKYEDDAGNWIPSLTQCLRLQGLTDYSGVDPDILNNAARRGSAVHQLAATLNKFGDVDPAWITDELQPYYESYLHFLNDTGFKVNPEWVETPIIAVICGFRVGITPDCHGWFGNVPAVIELKATATEMSSWAIQTALQEAAIYNSNRCGRARRHALMLRKDGQYRLLSPYMDHENDMAVGIAALRSVWWRINSGQDIRGLVASWS